MSLSSKKIAVILPIGYQGGTLNATLNIIKMLLEGSKKNNEKIQVIFAFLRSVYDIETDLKEIKELGCILREIEWQLISRAEVVKLLAFQSKKVDLYDDYYWLPKDNVSDLCDCDFWLLISDRTEHPIAPLKPYGMVIFDYIQRYIPQFLNSYFERSFLSSTRRAQFIFTTTPQTRMDVIHYAGVHPDKVFVKPMVFCPLIPPANSSKEETDLNNYFIWTTNISIHKNQYNAMHALARYYSQYQGNLNVIVTGVNTDFFMQAPENILLPHLDKTRNLINKHDYLKKNLKFMGNVSKHEYISYLQSAQFLWHPALFDNGTFSVLEAAYLGIPSLSSHYPQMSYINETFSLGLKFFDPNNIDEMAQALKWMEKHYQTQAKNLPNKETLYAYSWEDNAQPFWSLFRKASSYDSYSFI